jgi:hypothetical protein
MIEADLSGIWLLSLLSVIDMSLTYYILWYDRKINPDAPKFQELNPLARYIMKKTNYGPWGLVIGALTTQTLIWGIIGYFEAQYSVVAAMTTIQFVSGAVFVAIWIHTFSIQRLHRQTRNRTAITEIVGEKIV